MNNHRVRVQKKWMLNHSWNFYPENIVYWWITCTTKSQRDSLTKSHIGVNLLPNKTRTKLKYVYLLLIAEQGRWAEKRVFWYYERYSYFFFAVRFLLIVQACLSTPQLLWVYSSNLNTRNYFAKACFGNMYSLLILITIRKIHVHFKNCTCCWFWGEIEDSEVGVFLDISMEAFHDLTFFW